MGRPKRRWEDDLNEFLKTDETKEKTKYDLMNSNSWMTEAIKYTEWKEKEEKFFEDLEENSWIEKRNMWSE